MTVLPPDGTVVVVGASIAGITAVEELTARGHTGPIVLVEAEVSAPYAKPPLSKAVLSGAAEPESASIPLAESARIRRVRGDAAVRLDVAGSTVGLASGEPLPFDGLVIATGARARTVADLGGNTSGLEERVLRTLDDARRLRDELRTASAIVIVGAGVLGMELASVAASMGIAVTVLSNEAPLLSQCGPFVSALVEREARAHGVELVTDPSGVTLVERGGRLAARLGSTVYEGDLVVSAVGDRPNIEWLAGSGLVCLPGVVVDSRCRVTDRIVAAGDVAAFGSPPRRNPHWSNALDQARTAVAALLNGDEAPEYLARPYFWSDQFSLALKMGGHTPFLGEPDVLAGSLDDLDALVQWRRDGVPYGALAVNRRIAISKLHLAAGNPTANII
ncbi:FAD-dependent oxidoreductase [Herbiconiux sp. CPCC 203407]|uniref:FAD-dependent oxidoreductase n=1 Tax=Herbiconiux oxytropis TaxID=2970915 RepID=A0AA42BVT3_9MICO|nr:FAD-dependent oxidoreductase [Herbiconiux oxytropis]MCS5720775.1 FAD-dependent oxidoreductase [Herbiconiux oxytropis]MCS5724898.1 FAD-dependent oxidoreductase [Herbiconiux oxytropis]